MEERKKTDLWVNMNCTLEKIDPVEQSFQVNGWLNFFWVDKDLPSKQSVEKGFTIEDNAHNLPVNLQYVFENASESEIFGDPHFRYDSKHGSVMMTIRFKGTFSEELELDLFPFDRQFLTMRVCVRTNEFRILKEAPEYVPKKHNYHSLACYTASPTVSGWETVSPVVGFSKPIGGQCEDGLRLAISLRVGRHSSYYIWNILFPIFMVVSLGPTALLVPPSEVGERMGICLALLLTQVTFKFVVSSEVPKTSTMTLLDKYVVVSYIYIIGVVAQTVLLNVFIDPIWWNMWNAVSFVVHIGSWVWLNYYIVSNAHLFSLPWEDMKDEAAEGQPSISASEKNINLPDIRDH